MLKTLSSPLPFLLPLPLPFLFSFSFLWKALQVHRDRSKNVVDIWCSAKKKKKKSLLVWILFYSFTLRFIFSLNCSNSDFISHASLIIQRVCSVCRWTRPWQITQKLWKHCLMESKVRLSIAKILIFQLFFFFFFHRVSWEVGERDPD